MKCWPALIWMIAFAISSIGAAAGPLPLQEGLPPEFIIAGDLPLQQQLQILQDLRNWSEAHPPPRSGFLGGLKSLFGGGPPRPRPVPAEVLILMADSLRGSLVEVSGLYQHISAEIAQFPTENGEIRLSLPQGLASEGLPAGGGKAWQGLPVAVQGIVETGGSFPQIRVSSIQPSLPLTLIRMGRIYELLQQYENAQKAYEAAAKMAGVTPWGAFAHVNAARIAYEHSTDKNEVRKRFSSAWTMLVGKTPLHTWVPRDWWLPLAKNYRMYAETYNATKDGPVWAKMSVAAALGPCLDTLNRSDFWYQFMDFFVTLAGGSHWLGILLLAVISRILIWPLTKKQLASAEAMKRLQPQIKALQERYVDDKQKFQEEFWRLCQANGVNPLGGCLPMLIQFPILIFLYKGIREYIVQFQGKSFLWVQDLAAPDLALLVAYTISMILFQKMTQRLQPTTTMTPQQAQQQQMMTYMMPLMFFFFFQSFPAAFLLYWLATNVVYFVQQYAYTMAVERKKTDTEIESLAPTPKSGGFAGTMTRMLSMKAQKSENLTDKTETKLSPDEKKATAKGKKPNKSTEKGPGKRK